VTAAAILCTLALLPLGDILRAPLREYRASREAADLARLTASWPPERHDLALPAHTGDQPPSPQLVPARRVPGATLAPELAALAQAHLAPDDDRLDVELLERVAAGLRRLDQPDAMAQLRARRARPDWDTPTAEFHMIVGQLYTTGEYQELIRRWMCTSCEVGRDGERKHQSCTGCSCPCGVSVA
jgi:hypothetical protein